MRDVVEARAELYRAAGERAAERATPEQSATPPEEPDPEQEPEGQCRHRTHRTFDTL